MIATVTHARIRAAQGDVAGALSVLEVLLATSPRDAEALRLRETLVRRSSAATLRGWIARVRRRREARP